MQAKNGDRLRVHYRLRNDKGEEIESTYGGPTMDFTLGDGKVITGFEDGIRGMSPGDKRSINLTAEEAYGQRDDKKVFELKRERMPKDFSPQIGQVISLHRPDGSSFPATVIATTGSGFSMDANHPLAGQPLSFDIELIEIVST